MNVGIIGCGSIAPAYVKGCRLFANLDLVACADILPAAAAALAEKYGLKAMSIDGMLADPAIEIIINLTIPAVHAQVSLSILEAGKHVHSEKPLAVTREDGRQVLAAAAAKGLLVGCAPDTFLGGGLQTCRHLIDQGAIGTPVAAAAFMMGHGPESWHPNPDFFYKVGAGPMFDMGPYYLTALIHLLGPAVRVAGSARISFPERIATSEAKKGHRIPVEVPTHLSGSIDFASGAVATMIMSFDIWSHTLPRIEIYGSEGSLSVPDPNTFEGPVRLRKAGASEWQTMPLSHSDKVLRGVGVADMASAVLSGSPLRASGEQAYHVLDLMHSFGDSSDSGRHITLESSCSRPAPLPGGVAVEEMYL